MNARQNALSVVFSDGPSSTSNTVEFVVDTTNPISGTVQAALIALARTLGRQAAAEFMRLGIPTETDNQEEPRHA